MAENTLPARYIQVTFTNDINGTSERSNCLIDTGADMTVVPQNLADRLGLLPIDTLLITSLFGQQPMSIVQVRVLIGNENFIIRACVTRELNQPLLGWDIVNQGVRNPLFLNLIVGNIVHILNVIPSLKKTSVLILGQDTSKIDRLHLIKMKLSDLGYTGIIVKEIADIGIQSVEEKVNMLASLCRFVICENSIASGHIDELKICATNRFVTAILQQKGRGATWMQADYPIDLKFIKTFSYATKTEIPNTVEKAVKWAEKKLNERMSYLDKLYSWR